jgi:hypothetical protein
MQAAFAVLVLCGVMAAATISLASYENKTYAVGEGRDRFYTFDPQRTPFVSGLLLNKMIEDVKAKAPNARTLVAFPESAAVNYHLRLRDPVPEMEFLPTTMVFVGRDRVLKDLQDNPPDVAVLYMRDLTEYGAPCFGADPNSGLAIIQWLGQNYRSVWSVPAGSRIPSNITGNAYDIFVHVSPSPNSSSSPTPPAAQPPPATH